MIDPIGNVGKGIKRREKNVKEKKTIFKKSTFAVSGNIISVTRLKAKDQIGIQRFQ